MKPSRLRVAVITLPTVALLCAYLVAGTVRDLFSDIAGASINAAYWLASWAQRDSDTHPKDGDAQQAPLVSGAGPKDIAQNTSGDSHD